MITDPVVEQDMQEVHLPRRFGAFLGDINRCHFSLVVDGRTRTQIPTGGARLREGPRQLQ